MRLGNINQLTHDLPCGCDARKDIMFTYGQVGGPEALILTTAALVVYLTWRFNK
jgi:hypothetical protein